MVASFGETCSKGSVSQAGSRWVVGKEGQVLDEILGVALGGNQRQHRRLACKAGQGKGASTGSTRPIAARGKT